MPIPRPPHSALLPWLAALAGAVVVQLVAPNVPAVHAPITAIVVVPADAPRMHVEVEHAIGTYEYVLDRRDLDRFRAEQSRQRVLASSEGFRLGHVHRGSLFDELGFMTGDLVVDIEGGDVTRFHLLRGRARHPIDIVLRVA